MLHRLYLLGKDKNLTFNPDKLVAVLFSQKHKLKEHYLKQWRKYFKHKNTVKYLGLTLDRRLTWRPHIKNKIDACKGQLLKIINKYKHTTSAKPK